MQISHLVLLSYKYHVRDPALLKLGSALSMGFHFWFFHWQQVRGNGKYWRNKEASHCDSPTASRSLDERLRSNWESFKWLTYCMMHIVVEEYRNKFGTVHRTVVVGVLCQVFCQTDLANSLRIWTCFRSFTCSFLFWLNILYRTSQRQTLGYSSGFLEHRVVWQVVRFVCVVVCWFHCSRPSKSFMKHLKDLFGF